MIADAQITFLPSSDLARSREFYEGTLGFDLVVDQGSCHIFRTAPAGFVGTCLRDRVTASDGVIFTVVVDDVDGWCARIAAGGGPDAIERGPEHSEHYGIYHAFLRDPDGNLIEVQRFDDPNWAAAPK
jgi:catechol 2,3-dioxygenase-like lactoylglutathione lyase family enzyme